MKTRLNGPFPLQMILSNHLFLLLLLGHFPFLKKENEKMGKSIPRHLNVKSVKSLSKAHAAFSPANSKSGELIRAKQLSKCQQVRTQIHPNKISNLAQSAAGLLYRPKVPKTKAPTSSVKANNAKTRLLKKSLKSNGLSSKIKNATQSPMKNTMASSQKKSLLPSSSGPSSSSSLPSESSSSQSSNHRDSMQLSNPDPLGAAF